MSLADWDERLANAWIGASGDEGDFYRRSLINPVIAYLLDHEIDLSDGILHTAFASLLRQTPVAHFKFERLTTSPIDNALIFKPIKPDFVPTAPSEFMKQFPVVAGATRTVLDLGCGNGYRGRWLGKKNTRYLGVDGARRFVDFAQRATKNEGVDYLELDIESGEAINLIKRKLEAEGGAPNWIFAITLFDHLTRDSAIRLLEGLNGLQGLSSTGFMLVVTCNPQFYQGTPDAEKSVCVAFESLKDEDGSPLSAHIFHRSRSFYNRLFRDAGVTVLDYASPWPLTNSAEIEFQRHDNTVGPFYFWLLRLGGRSRRPLPTACVLAKVDEYLENTPAACARALLENPVVRSHCFELHVKHEESVVAAHNMGGRLFIVLRGSVVLRPEEFTPKISFGPGEVFGDLEVLVGSDSDERATYYRQSVFSHAPNSETVLLEISASAAATAVQASKGTLTNELLAMLRRRLQSQIWISGARRIMMGAKTCDLHASPGTRRELANGPMPFDQWSVWLKPDVSETHLQAVHTIACVLLGAWDYQRAYLPKGTPAVNTVVFKDFGDSINIAGQIHREAKDLAIRILCDAGVVLAWPFSTTNKGGRMEALTALKSHLTLANRTILPREGTTPPQLVPLKKLLTSTLEVHFVVLNDLLLLRRLAVSPTAATFRLLASAARFRRLRTADNRGVVPTYADLRTQYGPDARDRFEKYIALLINARVETGIASLDSLGVQL